MEKIVENWEYKDKNWERKGIIGKVTLPLLTDGTDHATDRAAASWSAVVTCQTPFAQNNVF